jgi:GNAT superfamily N-acetyltransferase
MSVTIRDFADADADWVVALLVGWDPSLPEAFWRRVVTGEAAPIRRCVVAECSGSPCGFAAVNDPEGLPYPLLNVLVVPEFRGRGIGSVLLAEVLAAVGAGDVGAGLPDHDARSLAVAQHWGFDVLGHGIDSILEFDGDLPAPTVPPGMAIRVAEGAQAVAAGWDIDGFLARVGDFPEAQIYGSELTNSVLLSMAPDLLWVLVVDEEGIAAACSLMPQDEGPWYIGFTGSDPRVRGRGLARLAKEAAHAQARARGARSVRTTNEERNDRIRALNAALGYRPVSGDLRLVRRAR